jgi:hypothetical protein
VQLGVRSRSATKLRESRCEIAWERRVKLDALAGHRVNEAEHGGVKRKAGQRDRIAARIAVDRVGEDRVAEVGKMDAYLVRPTGTQLGLHE